MEAPKSWSQFRGLLGDSRIREASNKPHRREVQEASSDSVWFGGRQPVLVKKWNMEVRMLLVF
jgi:hypothetical protein